MKPMRPCQRACSEYGSIGSGDPMKHTGQGGKRGHEVIFLKYRFLVQPSSCTYKAYLETRTLLIDLLLVDSKQTANLHSFYKQMQFSSWWQVADIMAGARMWQQACAPRCADSIVHQHLRTINLASYVHSTRVVELRCNEWRTP